MAAGARAARIPEEEWDKHRAHIEFFYIQKNMNLTEVIESMERVYQFHATDKQYKRQLANWGIRKNISTKEMKALLDDHVNNPTVRGNEVPKAKLTRFVRRQKMKASKPGPERAQTIPSPVRPPSNSTPGTLPPSLSTSSHSPWNLEMTNKPWQPKHLVPQGMHAVPDLEHCLAITLLQTIVKPGPKNVFLLDDFVLDKAHLSQVVKVFKPSYWEWQRLILAFIFLQRLSYMAPDTTDKGDLLLRSIIKWTDTYMSPAQSLEWECRVDYCCTQYEPEKENTALTGLPAQVISEFQTCPVKESHFTVVSKFVEKLCSSHVEATGKILLTADGCQQRSSSMEIGENGLGIPSEGAGPIPPSSRLSPTTNVGTFEQPFAPEAPWHIPIAFKRDIFSHFHFNP